MTQTTIRKLVADSVAPALKAQAGTMANTNNTNRNTGEREALVARKCSYKEFMSCQPINFNGTEGVVNFATGTSTKEALSWWISFAQPIRIEEAYKITWVEFKKLLIKKEKGHYANQCRKTTTNNAQGRAYMLRDRNAHQDPNVVTGFDVVIGMDWLSKYHARIICDKKVIHIPSNGETLIIRELPNQSNSGATPVARAPYRLAPLEMQELSNQLQELADRGGGGVVVPVLMQRRESYYICIARQLKPNEEQYTTHDLELGAIAEDRQRSYANVKAKSLLNFHVGDRGMFKRCHLCKGILPIRENEEESLNPPYIGPFKILERIGPVAYKLELPEELSEWLKFNNRNFSLDSRKEFRKRFSEIRIKEIEFPRGLDFEEFSALHEGMALQNLNQFCHIKEQVVWEYVMEFLASFTFRDHIEELDTADIMIPKVARDDDVGVRQAEIRGVGRHPNMSNANRLRAMDERLGEIVNNVDELTYVVSGMSEQYDQLYGEFGQWQTEQERMSELVGCNKEDDGTRIDSSVVLLVGLVVNGIRSRLEPFVIVIHFVEYLAHYLLKVPVTPKVGTAIVASPVGVIELDTHSSSEADPSESSLPPVSIAPMVSPFLCSDDSYRVASRSSSPTTSISKIRSTPIPPAPSAIGLTARKSVRPLPSYRLALRYTSHHSDRFTSRSSSDHSSSGHSTSGHSSSDHLSLDHSSSRHSVLGHSVSGHTPPVTTIADSSAPSRFVYPPLARTPRDSSSESSAGPSRKRCRSPAATVISFIHTSRALVPSCVDLLLPRKRFRDSISLEDNIDVEAGVDAGIGMEVNVRVDVEDEVKGEVESSDKGTMEEKAEKLTSVDLICEERYVNIMWLPYCKCSSAGRLLGAYNLGVATPRALVYVGLMTSGDARSWYMISEDAKSWVNGWYWRLKTCTLGGLGFKTEDVVVGIDIPDGMLMPDAVERLEQRVEDIETGQREWEARSLIAGGESAGLLDHVASLERSNARLRGTLMIESMRADRFRRRMGFMESEIRQIRMFRYYDKMRFRRLETFIARRLGFRP
ncbi:hypothetical protein Tco_0336125 [Tanacetum coccineum]